MIKPLNGNLLVKPEKVDEVKSASGIILSNEKDIAIEKATVIASFEGSSVEEGMTVYYKDYALSIVKNEQEEYNFLKEEDVLGYS